jgi:predicted RecA/RadA family phage recombinase
MANLTAARAVQRGDGIIRPYKVAAVDIFAGALVSVVPATGYAQRAGDTATHKFVGVADKTVKNAGGAAGAKKVRVWAKGVFDLACSGADQTWVGQKVYVVDDQTVALAATTTNDVLVGVVTEVVSATKVFVALTPDE